MPDSTHSPNNSEYAAKKLRSELDLVLKRTAGKRTTELSTLLSEAQAAFYRFFTELGDPIFRPKFLKGGDPARSSEYNENLEGIYEDIRRYYNEIVLLAESQLKSFNFATVVNEEITKRADALAGTVLDLKILNDFTRGDVVVAGDDFRTLDNVDRAAAVASAHTEKLQSSGGMTLAREGRNELVGSDTKISFFPISPTNGSVANFAPTPGNLERFYEGNYYAFLGHARPEGGVFNIKYIVDPSRAPGEQEDNKQEDGKDSRDPNKKYLFGGGSAEVTELEDRFTEKNIGYFVDLGASEDVKQEFRRRMIDGNADTFWELEYVYASEPLIDNVLDNAVIEDSSVDAKDPQTDNAKNTDLGFDENQGPKGAIVNIDIRQAENAAKAFDFAGRDLIVDLVLDLRQPTPINFVLINPILFGTQAFITVDDISTADSDKGQFVTVDGWRNLKFSKTITPEANEFLTDSQVGQTLAPSRFEYTGQGVFAFPVRIASRIKLRLRMDNPVPSIYERVYVLLKNRVEVETTKTTVTKRGKFRF